MSFPAGTPGPQDSSVSTRITGPVAASSSQIRHEDHDNQVIVPNGATACAYRRPVTLTVSEDHPGGCLRNCQLAARPARCVTPSGDRHGPPSALPSPLTTGIGFVLTQ